MIRTYRSRLIRHLAKPTNIAQALNVLRHYASYPRSKHVISGGINITHRCNLTCSFCVFGLGVTGAKMKDMPIGVFERCLNAPALKHAAMISFGLGEPLLHKDLFSFIGMIQRRGKLVSFATNAMLIHKRLDELLATPPDFMYVSHYDEFWDKQSAKFDLFLEARPRSCHVGISKIIGRRNVSDIGRIVELGLEKKVDFVWFQQYSATDDPGLVSEQIYDDDKKALEQIESMRKELKHKAHGLDITYPAIMRRAPDNIQCKILFKGFNLEPNGAIQPCCYIDVEGQNTFGNVFEDQLAHTRQDTYMELKTSLQRGRTPDTCRDCPGLYVG